MKDKRVVFEKMTKKCALFGKIYNIMKEVIEPLENCDLSTGYLRVTRIVSVHDKWEKRYNVNLEKYVYDETFSFAVSLPIEISNFIKMLKERNLYQDILITRTKLLNIRFRLFYPNVLFFTPENPNHIDTFVRCWIEGESLLGRDTIINNIFLENSCKFIYENKLNPTSLNKYDEFTRFEGNLVEQMVDFVGRKSELIEKDKLDAMIDVKITLAFLRNECVNCMRIATILRKEDILSLPCLMVQHVLLEHSLLLLRRYMEFNRKIIEVLNE